MGGLCTRIALPTRSHSAVPNGWDHWPYCYSVQFAGAGVPAGLIYGASDQQAAYPSRDPVTPADIAATIYTLLGISHDAEIFDNQGRPHRVQIGKPIEPLLG